MSSNNHNLQLNFFFPKMIWWLGRRKTRVVDDVKMQMSRAWRERSSAPIRMHYSTLPKIVVVHKLFHLSNSFYLIFFLLLLQLFLIILISFMVLIESFSFLSEAWNDLKSCLPKRAFASSRMSPTFKGCGVDVFNKGVPIHTRLEFFPCNTQGRLKKERPQPTNIL